MRLGGGAGDKAERAVMDGAGDEVTAAIDGGTTRDLDPIPRAVGSPERI